MVLEEWCVRWEMKVRQRNLHHHLKDERLLHLQLLKGFHIQLPFSFDEIIHFHNQLMIQARYRDAFLELLRFF